MTHEMVRWNDTHTVRFKLTDIEPKDQARFVGDRRAEKFWQPTQAVVTWEREADDPRWTLRSVFASGPRLKKDGTEFGQDHFSHSWNAFLDKTPNYPDWLRECVKESAPVD